MIQREESKKTKEKFVYITINIVSNMDERKRAFEGKFAQDQELAFRVESRACRLMGMWVAEQLGLSEDDSKLYAREVVSANLDEPGLNDVLRKIRADLLAKSIEISDHTLHKQIEKFLADAKEQLMHEEG